MKKFLAIAFLIASPLVAGVSKKYKGWEKSPEAYFLTRDEKSEWKKVKTDEEAEKFVVQYRAKRGPGFFDDLAKRIAIADKHFSAGSTKGSETLRGKVIIVFGPPSGVNAGGPVTTSAGPSGTEARQAATEGGGGGKSDSFSSGAAGGTKSPIFAAHSSGVGTAEASAPSFTISYDQSAAPKAIGKPFYVELKMISTTEQVPSNPKDLEEKFEAVAKASQVASATP